MFTGIIESLGRVEAIELVGDSAIISIDAGLLVEDLPVGGSLAVNGVCLTSVRDSGPDTSGPVSSAGAPGIFTAEAMGETLRLTGLGSLAVGDAVNLERCTPAGGRLDGHVVQGHVDGRGTLLSKVDFEHWSTLRIAIPADLAPYTALKGSIALNGVSLTLTGVSEPGAGVSEPGAGVAESDATPESSAGHEGTAAADEGTESTAWVEVGLIPATLEHTTFGTLEPGAPVNIEVDVLAKYTARLLSFGAGPAASGTGSPATGTASTTDATAPTDTTTLSDTAAPTDTTSSSDTIAPQGADND